MELGLEIRKYQTRIRSNKNIELGLEVRKYGTRIRRQIDR